jgi:hypothetical protein
MQVRDNRTPELEILQRKTYANAGATAAPTPEQELPVQVGYVDGVHVNHVHICEA